MGAPTVTYICGAKDCGLLLFTVDEDGELALITRHQSVGSPGSDYHRELAVYFGRERGDKVPVWLEARHILHIEDETALNVWCPGHGRWTVDAGDVRTTIVEATANGRSRVRLRGTAAEPLLVLVGRRYRTAVHHPEV